MSLARDPARRAPFYCAFCGKSNEEVKKLIAGPVCLICDECVWLMVDILSCEGIVPPWQKPLEAEYGPYIHSRGLFP